MASNDLIIRSAGRFCRTSAVAAVVWGVALAPMSAAAQFNVIHPFVNIGDGEYPEAGLTAGPNGTLYGTTFGAVGVLNKSCPKGCNNGSEYRVNQQDQVRAQYSFPGGQGGAFPTGEVAIDSSGNVFGTTEFGGGTACDGIGCGTAFEIKKSGTIKTYRFCTGADYPACTNGAFPHAGPIVANDGSDTLYGTTSLGGGGTGLYCENDFGGCGTIYALTGFGKDAEKVVYNFCAPPLKSCTDGAVPYGKLWQDPSAGNLYGTTQFGGANGAGVIFEFQLSTGTYTVLYNFCSAKGCRDGGIPEAGLIADSEGNFYGTASAGGTTETACQGSYPGCGVVFEFTPSTGSYTVLHRFIGGATDGWLPQSPLVQDPSTLDLYGTTNKGGGGPYCIYPTIGCGTVFVLEPAGTTWNESVIYAFGAVMDRSDGAQPEGSLLLSPSAGLLYGVTRVQGDPTCKCGTLFTVSVVSPAAKSVRAQTGRPHNARSRSQGVGTRAGNRWRQRGQ